MRVLITGAGGFLGAAVVRATLAEGWSVVAVARQVEPPRLAGFGSRITRAAVDMADSEGLRQLILDVRPDVVVHAAWSGLASSARASAGQIDDNVLPACRLVEAAVEAGVGKFIGIGSQGEYGPFNRRVVETDLPAPVSMYGAAKLATCQLVNELARAAKMDFAWLRLFATYGPGDNPNWLIPRMIAELRSGARPRTTLGTQKWDYLYIDDAAAGIVAAARTKAALGVFNLGSGEAVAVRTIIEHLRDLTAPELELVFGEVPFGPDQIMHMEADIDRLRHCTGWSPRVSLLEGLRRTAVSVDETKEAVRS